MALDPTLCTWNLFKKMENDRENKSNAAREDYIPIFFVKSLQNKLLPTKSDTQSSFGKRILPSTNSEDAIWDDDDDDLFEAAVFIDEGLFLLSKENREYFMSMCNFMTELKKYFSIDQTEFYRLFAADIVYPCLEILYLMDTKYHLMELTSYILELKSQSQLDYLSNQIKALSFSPLIFNSEEKGTLTEILQHFIKMLMLSAYCNPGESASLVTLRTFAESLLNQIVQKLISDEDMSHLNRQFLLAILKGLSSPDFVKRKFLSSQLSQFVARDAKLTTLDVVRKLEVLTNPIEEEEGNKLDIIRMMVKQPQKHTEVIIVIREAINLYLSSGPIDEQDQLNWEHLLYTILEWVKHAEHEAVSLLRDLIKTLMKNGLSNQIEKDVLASFILARYLSLITPQLFARYEKWYSHTFENETYSPANTSETFMFLAATLSKLVEHEPPTFLQVQATFWPHIPGGSNSECKSIWSSYVSNAKQRVTEYNQVEAAMSLDPLNKDPIQHEVDMAIKYYGDNNKFAPALGHMIMWEAKKYKEQFLPTLLKKPVGDDKTDARKRLVELLNKRGKIPANLYNEFKGKKMPFK